MKESSIKAEQSQVVFVSPATLEDRLLYDDVFVDYFNVFLQLKVFGTAIRYERLDGYYLDKPESFSDNLELQQLVDGQGKFLQQGAISLWIKEHRLPFFLRSCLFLEYKLCKLLLRKLSDTSRVQQSRLELRGYSRVSSPLGLPDSPEHWDDSPVDYASQASWPGGVEERHYHRPLGSASSLPAMLSIALETRLKLLEGPPAKRMSNDNEADLTTEDINHSRPVQVTHGPDAFGFLKCKTECPPCLLSEAFLGDQRKASNSAERKDSNEDLLGLDENLKVRSAGRRMKNRRKSKSSLFTSSCKTREESRKEKDIRRTKSAPVEGKTKNIDRSSSRDP